MSQELPIPPDLDPEFGCYAIRWPISVEWRSFLLGFFDSMQFGPTWDPSTGSLIDVLAVGREIFFQNQDLEEVLLTCGNIDELVSAIATASATATSSSGCGACDSGSRGVGQEAPPANEEPLLDDGIEPPPEGYDDWAEYDQYKCNAATLIVDNIIADLGRMDGGALLGLSLTEIALGIAAIILTPIPADDILAIAAIILAITALVLDVFGDAQTLINSNRDEFICALYESASVGAAEIAFNGLVEEKADVLFPSQPSNYYIKTLLSYMVTPANLNRLVTRDEFLEYPIGDCSSCAACLPVWCFDDGVQGWIGVDESDPSCFAFTVWNDPLDALNTNLQLPSLPNLSAIGRWTLTLAPGTIVTAGDVLQADVLATSDGNQTQLRFEAHYTDLTSDIGPNLLWSGATQLQYVIPTTGKELATVQVVVSRSTGAGAFGSATNNYIEQIAMNFQNPVVCPTGPCDP